MTSWKKSCLSESMEVFYNANIYAPDTPGATALVIDNGCFTWLGSDSEILSKHFEDENKINCQGKTIWPGLTDAHVHLQILADSMAIVNCETGTMGACLANVKNAANQFPQGSWVRGHGWNHNQWEEGLGTAAILDAVTQAHPAYLTAKSLHAAWANSRALAIAGIDEHTPDPPSGVIQRDKSGKPTGILLEAGAMRLVESVIPKPTLEEIQANIRSLIPALWGMGLIGVHDFDGIQCWQALQLLHQNGEFPFRIRKNVPFDHLDTFIKSGLQTNDGNDWLNVGCLKLFADGALGPQTAAMKEPYVGGDNTGQLLLSSDEILEIGKKAVNHGIALSIHAIGDRANEVVLNAYARLRAYEEENHLPYYRHRIEHVQIIHPTDIQRLKKLDIIASIQPIHAPSDMQMADKYLGSRSHNAYAYKSILNRGVRIVCGSDAPVEPVNPFFGLHAAVTRRTIKGQPGPEGWHPEQRLPVENALDGFSYQPAVISARGSHLGKIKTGYRADFLILEVDPFQINPHLISKIKPAATFIEGKCFYKDPNLDMEFNCTK